MVMKRVATDDAVFDACAQLEAAGLELSVRTVQERVGGSYTTVQKVLERWPEEKLRRRAAHVEVPEPLVESAAALLRQTFAAGEAHQRDAQAAERQARQSELESVRRAAADAAAEVERLEASEREQAARVEALLQRVHELELSASADKANLQGLQARLKQLEADLEGARQAIATKDGELADLRAREGLQAQLQQLQDQVASLAGTGARGQKP